MRKKGFTLLELLIVMIILGILAAIALPRYFANLQKAYETEAKATLDSIRQTETAYAAVNDGKYTSTFPITVNISGGTPPDVYLAQPSSLNFTYSVLPAVSPVYAQAARKNPPNPNSYCMNLETGCFKTSCANAAVCDCTTCP